MVAKKTEHQLQSMCVSWFRLEFPKRRFDLFAVPNGGKRDVVTASIMKREGIVKGVPDILLVDDGRLHAFEFKTLIGKLSEAQQQVHVSWLRQRVDVHIIRDFETFQKIIRNILNQ